LLNYLIEAKRHLFIEQVHAIFQHHMVINLV